jgi:hypothetical protein
LQFPRPFQFRNAGFDVLNFDSSGGVIEMLSAALTRTEADALGSTMIFIRAAAAALVARCNRAIDWPNACRRDSRDTAANSGILSQRRSVLVPIPAVQARERIETAVEAAGEQVKES